MAMLKVMPLRKKGECDLHKIFGKPTTMPINVNAKNGYETTSTDPEVSWTLHFGNGGQKTESDIYYETGVLDLQKINIFVKHEDKAEWLLVSDYDAPNAVDAPQKICVPQTVDWPDEDVPIATVYPGFKTWVANPSIPFWNSGSNARSQTQMVQPGISQNYNFNKDVVDKINGGSGYYPPKLQIQASETSEVFALGLLTADGEINQTKYSNSGGGYWQTEIPITADIRDKIIGIVISYGSIKVANIAAN